MTHPLPQGIRFGRDVCGDLDQAERREWWLSNGLGGYAAGTVAGTLTRRYHGLLIAATRPPVGRRLLFAKADATLLLDDIEWPLHANRWAGGAVVPTGHHHIEAFWLDGRMPVWRYAFGALRIEHRIWMEPGASTTYAAWRLDPASPRPAGSYRLRVSLLVANRDHHQESVSGDLDPEIEGGGATLTVTHPDGLRLTLIAGGGTIAPERMWIEWFDLSAERERGLFDHDNHLRAGTALLDLKPGEWTGIVASLEDAPSDDFAAALARFRQRDESVLMRAASCHPEFRDAPDWIDQLVLASDSFLIARPISNTNGGMSVIAGYPWFADWGRDTMIALSGLTLATGRHDIAHRILETFARFADQGMLPNVFPEAGEPPPYNAVDAALWYIQAWRIYVETTGDRTALGQALPVLRQIVEGYYHGTRHGIRVDPADGLVTAGDPGLQLTWMDAKLGDWVVTPRIGKPVEINALWYNALCIMAGIDRAGAERYRTWAEAARLGFQRFVRPDGGGLFDVLEGPNGDDPSIRPNQIFAVSLPHSPLDPAMRERVVRECGELLLCSYGLRTLAPADPAFRPLITGDPHQRDAAYHQGTVWAWLLGPYALAEYRVHGDAAAALSRLEPLRDHLSDAGLGTISEIFDGRAPHLPRGCPAQAWSVACTLEAWWRLRRNQRAAG